MSFHYATASTSGHAQAAGKAIVRDEITLKTADPVEKLSISFAFAQSLALSVHEDRVDEYIESMRHYPHQLASTGTTGLTQKQLSMEIGRLFIERNQVNLHLDILDTSPEFFWEEDTWEPLYAHSCKYLEMESRVAILNSRLDIMQDLLDILGQQMTHQHDTRLEWIIILLIIAEVFYDVVWSMLIKDILGLNPTIHWGG